MPLPLCLRLRCTCSRPFVPGALSWIVKSTLITFHAIFWSECLGFATQSQAVRMSVNSMRSTQQIVNNWKLKAVESVSAKMTGPSHVNECILDE